MAQGTVAEQERALFWASELPLKIFGGGTLLLAIVLSAYLVIRKHGWLAIPLCIYHVVAAFVIFVGSFIFVSVKPPGM